MKHIMATVTLFMLLMGTITFSDSLFRAYGFLSHSAPGETIQPDEWNYQKLAGLHLFGAGLSFNPSWLQSNAVFFQTNYATAYDVQVGVRRDFIGLYYGKQGAITTHDSHDLLTPQYIGIHLDGDWDRLNFRVDAQYGFGNYTLVYDDVDFYGFQREAQKDFSSFIVAPQVSYHLGKNLYAVCTLGSEKYNFTSKAQFCWTLGFVFGSPFQRFYHAPRSMNFKAPDTHLMRKPNIYLYPETAMQVDVSLQPKGYITVSIPDYGSGWSVWAEPNGRLDNAYDFLFYEAEVPLAKPNVGWCVSADELEFFFSKTLQSFGFNEKEIYDFLDYWLPLLNDAPFYEIRPMVNEELDWVCPISIVPQPDHLLRLWLIFTPAQHHTELPAPVIPFFSRAGFCATEWGGAVVP